MKYLYSLRVILVLLAWPLRMQAQEAAVAGASPPVLIKPPAGVRLGAWLTQNHADVTGQMYMPGLMWTSPSEAQQQEREKAALLQELISRAQEYPKRAKWLADLKSMLSNLPVTGRKSLPLQDPWLMQAHSGLEPLTGSNDELRWSGRPDRVRVITPDMQWCDVQVLPGRWAMDYLKACGVDKVADTAWLIQPNGQVSQLKTGEWNGEKQEAPAPGSWLWVTPNSNSPKLSLRIAKFIATQGVAQGASPPLVMNSPPSPEPQSLPVIKNDWGMAGNQQTPSARTPPAGQVSLTANRVWPYTHTTLSLSPFDNVELGFRYTNITNQFYNPAIAGDQGYKDKSAEIKWRILDETADRPAFALGLRDPGGTGLFAGEYAVASKRWNHWDLSLGLGWGYLGARGNLSNPLRILGQRFSNRQLGQIGSGGTAQLGSLFTGRAALFGGVQWITPLPNVVLKVELDGNDYKHEPLGNQIGGARSPLNWGLAWHQGPLSVSVGYERGQQWMLGFTLSTDVSQMARSKSSEAAPWPVTRAPVPMTSNVPAAPFVPSQSVQANDVHRSSNGKAALSISEALEAQTGWSVSSLRQEADVWQIEFENAQGFSLPERIDRGMSVVHELAPSSVRSVQFVFLHHGVPVSRRELDRVEWASQRYAWRGTPAVHASTPNEVDANNNPQNSVRKPLGSVGFSYQQHLGGPDGYLYALNATARGEVPLWNGAWAQATVNARLLDNFNHFHYTAPSHLPRVRTHVREYLTDHRVTLPLAQINQLNAWGDGLYSLVYAGALESMFAGVGAEVLWRPIGQPWALGVDMNKLAQRDFDQRFSLRDYRVHSGHVSAYWDTGWQGLEAKMMLGQYLAGDRGVTFEVARRFDNGARMGAWVTKTNVSSADFGEGSFDKGVFISIPFDAFLSAWSTQTASVVWQPLIRDGGARLNKAQNLWTLTKSRDEREWSEKPKTTQP